MAFFQLLNTDWKAESNAPDVELTLASPMNGFTTL